MLGLQRYARTSPVIERRLAPVTHAGGESPEGSRVMSSNALERIGGSRFRRDLPAFGLSLAVHLGFLITLGLMTIAARADLRREISSALVDTSLPELDSTSFQDLDQADVPATLNPAGSTAPQLSPIAMLGSAPPTVAAKPTTSDASMIALAGPNVSRPGDLVVPRGPTIRETVTIRNNAPEQVGGVEGAVDRIATELLTRLERGRTLVVWAFDASGSLQVEREKLAKHIEQVYKHISELDKDQVTADDALLTMVVAFGKERKPMLPAPTSDPAAILSAIREVPLDTSGVETTFTTVGQIVQAWGKFKDKQKRDYQTVVIVVTDEVGDDESELEPAISKCVAAKVPVYVLGSPSPFGKVEGRMDYRDPKTKKLYRNLPVRAGPESVALEAIHLPFWYGGDQYDNLDAGFGPYALSRLTGATGGIYFITRIGPTRLGFDANGMREYRPDWVSRAAYEKSLEKDPIKRAVFAAAQITQQNLPGQPGLTFPPADTPEFKETMTQNQETVARIAYTVDEALGPITSVSKQRDREPSRRWQAHYDLIRGRLLAMKIRCYEYNTACARMKKDPLKFKDSKSNAWRLVPSEEVLSGDKVAQVAKEAQALLKRVEDNHPNTPWALLAHRELKDPMGLKWVETFVPPPPKRSDAEVAAAKKKAVMKKDDKPETVPLL
jgi:hypothetical protein